MTFSKKTLGFVFLALVSAIFLLSGCFHKSESEKSGLKKSEPVTQPVTLEIPEPPDSTYVIGGLAPLTGSHSEYGLAMQTVAEIAVEKINSIGGINTTPLEIVWEDSACSDTEAEQKAQKLITREQVKVILGGFCSSETLGAANVAEKNKVVMLSYASGSPEITNAGDYIFRTYPSDALQGKMLAEFALTQGLKKAGMLTEENDYTVGIATAFQAVFETGGGAVLSERFLSTDTDFRTQLLVLRDAEVDLVFVNPATPEKADLLFQQMGEQPVSARLFANDVVMGWKEGLIQYEKLVEGMMGATVSFDDKNPEFMDFLSAYRQKTEKEELSYPAYSTTTYDAVMIIAEALTRFGNDADKVKEYLYTIKDRQGLAGKLTLDENGDPMAGYGVYVIIAGKAQAYEAPAL